MSTKDKNYMKATSTKGGGNTFHLLGKSLRLLLQLVGPLLKSRIVLLQSFDLGLQKIYPL